MSKKSSKTTKIIGFLVIIILAVWAYYSNFTAISLKDNYTEILPSLFAYFLLISIFVERAIEIFLSSLRSREADELDRSIERNKNHIQRIKSALKNADPNEDVDDTEKEPEAIKDKRVTYQDLYAAENELETVNDKRVIYRADSRYISIWIGLVIGMFVALAGIRFLGNIIDDTEFTCQQQGLFSVVDVLLTGSILAGGSEAFNKITKVYYSFMNKAASNNNSSNTTNTNEGV